MNKKLKLAIIYGSNREGRFCDVIANWAISEINKRNEFELLIIDPVEMGLGPTTEKNSAESLNEFRGKIKEADAYLVIVPEYNHGYPAVLKYLIDSDYAGWRAKPVGYVSYGGISGGIRAVEQLKLVFNELHAISIRDAVHLANAWEQFDKDGQMINPTKADKAMTTTLHQLQWWAETLKEGRQRKPYS